MADISKIRLENETYNIKDETARNDINILKLPRNSFANRKIILIGDSYAEGYTPDGNVTSWQTFFKNLTSLSNTITKYQGGAGFVNISADKNFQTLLEEVTSDTEVTDIIVLGGYNDTSYNSTQIKNAMKSFQLKANEKFPNANLYVGMVGWSKNSNMLYNLNRTISRYKISASACNMAYLNNIEYSLHEYFLSFASDGIHANEHGQYMIALYLIQAFLNGSADVQFEYTNVNLTPNSNITLENVNSIGTMLINNIVELSCQENPIIRINSDKPSASGGSNILEFATITSGYVVGWTNPIIKISVKLVIGCDEGFINCQGILQIMNGKFRLQFGKANDAGNGYQSFSNISQIQMYGFHAILNTQFC